MLMKIREVSWSNYRRLPDGRIEVRDHLVLVGPNDSGKSSVLRALYLCLGMPHGQMAASLGLRDFTNPTLPLTLSVVLDGIEDEDRAAFPDEISTQEGETLIVSVEATLDPVDTDQKTVRRFFPDSGHTRAPNKQQLATIGFAYVPAVRSLMRELGGASGGAVRSLLSGLDLSADAVALEEAADHYQKALAGSEVLKDFRTELSAALSAALPTPVSRDDVRIVSEAEIVDDPLAGVTVTVHEGDHEVPLAEQSDGIRALSVLTLLGMSHKTARIIGVDEPETHLHPTAQRALARLLIRGRGQRVVVTHSPAVVSEMSPLDIVTFRADRRTSQLPRGAPIADLMTTVRHWSSQLIEPLTARCVLLVEGVSDRILVERVAELGGLDLDRAGVAIFELDGSGSFPNAYKIFGPPGFDLPLAGLLDEDAREAWADEIGVPSTDLEVQGYVVCNPDLEGVYIDCLGPDAVISMLLASPTLTERSLLNSCRAAAVGDVTRDQLWAYCRAKKRKVLTALAVASAIDEAQARSIAPLTEILQLVV